LNGGWSLAKKFLDHFNATKPEIMSSETHVDRSKIFELMWWREKTSRQGKHSGIRGREIFPKVTGFWKADMTRS